MSVLNSGALVRARTEYYPDNDSGCQQLLPDLLAGESGLKAAGLFRTNLRSSVSLPTSPHSPPPRESVPKFRTD